MSTTGAIVILFVVAVIALLALLPWLLWDFIVLKPIFDPLVYWLRAARARRRG